MSNWFSSEKSPSQTLNLQLWASYSPWYLNLQWWDSYSSRYLNLKLWDSYLVHDLCPRVKHIVHQTLITLEALSGHCFAWVVLCQNLNPPTESHEAPWSTFDMGVVFTKQPKKKTRSCFEQLTYNFIEPSLQLPTINEGMLQVFHCLELCKISPWACDQKPEMDFSKHDSILTDMVKIVFFNSSCSSNCCCCCFPYILHWPCLIWCGIPF